MYQPAPNEKQAMVLNSIALEMNPKLAVVPLDAVTRLPPELTKRQYDLEEQQRRKRLRTDYIDICAMEAVNKKAQPLENGNS